MRFKCFVLIQLLINRVKGFKCASKLRLSDRDVSYGCVTFINYNVGKNDFR